MKRLMISIVLVAVLLTPSGAAHRLPTTLASIEQTARPYSPDAAPPYTITDLGTLGGNLSKAFGINRKQPGSRMVKSPFFQLSCLFMG